MAKNDKIDTLTGADIIRIMREEWDARLEGVAGMLDEMDLQYKQASGTEKDVVSPGLKVKHKDSGLLYTVDALSMQDVVLRTSEGEQFTVTHDDLESSYELD